MISAKFSGGEQAAVYAEERGGRITSHPDKVCRSRRLEIQTSNREVHPPQTSFQVPAAPETATDLCKNIKSKENDKDFLREDLENKKRNAQKRSPMMQLNF